MEDKTKLKYALIFCGALYFFMSQYVVRKAPVLGEYLVGSYFGIFGAFLMFAVLSLITLWGGNDKEYYIKNSFIGLVILALVSGLLLRVW